MTLDELKQKLPNALDESGAAGVEAVIQFSVSTPCYLSISGGAATVTDGEADDPRLTVTMADDDLVAMMQGELDGMTAFMTGQLQIDGDIMFAQQLGSLFDGDKLK